MNAMKGRLKVALLVVGGLLVSLGMYVVFHVSEGEATHSSSSCSLKLHKPGSTSYVAITTATTSTRTKIMNCSNCPGMPKKNHTQRKYKTTYYYSQPHYHKYPWQSSYSMCHTHTWQSWSYNWVTVLCGG